jgi:hypothetical protein
MRHARTRPPSAAPIANGPRASPAIAFQAVARAGIANALVVIEELEKAPSTVTTWGEGLFWNCLLSFLEPTTSGRYPDPVVGPIDLSHISYMATATM